jgi:hypothetical protein
MFAAIYRTRVLVSTGAIPSFDIVAELRFRIELACLTTDAGHIPGRSHPFGLALRRNIRRSRGVQEDLNSQFQRSTFG